MLLALTGCRTDEIDLYSDNSYIYFTNDSDNVIEYSFVYEPGVQTGMIPLSISLIGSLDERAREVSMRVASDKSDAPQGTYDLPSQTLLGALKARDTVWLTVYKNEAMRDVKYKLRIEINDNGNFLAGPTTNRFIDVVFSDMVSRPAWWDDTIVNNFLGVYTNLKYRLFIEATGTADLTDASENETWTYTAMFRDFLLAGRENATGDDPFTDDDGRVDVSPTFR